MWTGEEKGIPREKLCIGLANYGFIYRELKPGVESSVKLDKKGQYFSHTQLADLLADRWTEWYDEEAQAPYYFSPESLYKGRNQVFDVGSIGRFVVGVLGIP